MSRNTAVSGRFLLSPQNTPGNIRARYERRFEPHVEPLNRWVERLRESKDLPPGAGDTIPWFDPRGGGAHAPVIFVQQDPSRTAAITQFCSPDNDDITARNATIACERAGCVRVFVDGHMVVSRHLAVLASTGAGKTVATRKILEELMVKGYPILIFDPHGDYAGLHIAKHTEVTTYLPEIRLADEEFDQVLGYIRGMSGEVITPAQEPLITSILEVLSDEGKRAALDAALRDTEAGGLQKTVVHDHFYAIAEVAEKVAALKAMDDRAPLPREITRISGGLNVGASTANAVRRQTRKAGWQYWNMIKTNRKYSDASTPLPTTKELHKIIKPAAVAIVSLEGYSDELRQSIVANVLSRLLGDRIDEKVPRFLTVIEEAHNFIPGWSAGGAGAGEAPSLPVIKQIATEGRKYGMGLIFISQRPSRIDATVLSQANSYLILRIVNPNDQKYIRDVVETMGEDEAKALPNLNTGEALLSGLFTRIPVMVRVEKSRSEGKHEEEDFLADVKAPGGAALAAEDGAGWAE